ncbi:MAG: 3'-5' exonuclease [Nanoarchaeota archaeon]
MKGFIVYPTYKIEDNKAYVYLFGRLENGESFLTINYFRAYFYIKADDLERAKRLAKFEFEKTNFLNFNKERVVKIIVNIPKDVPHIKKNFSESSIQSYEADIRFAYRFLIDYDIKGCIDIQGEYKKGESINRIYNEPEIKPTSYLPELETLSIDIETSMDSNRILSIALYNEKFKKVLICK